MKIKQLWHVYYGTRGTAGSYIDALQKAAAKTGLNSIAFVSTRYRYKTPGIHKIFFPLSEHTERRNLLIKAVRFFELALGYKYLFFRALISRPIINLNLIDDLYLTYSFFKLLKFFKLKVFITCHDVLSHHKGLTKRRNTMFLEADRLIVHSSFAYGVLADILETGKQKKDKIIRFPFPSSPYDEILSTEKMAAAEEKIRKELNSSNTTPGKTTDYFLFIGIVRQSKGIDTLADAWEIYTGKTGNTGNTGNPVQPANPGNPANARPSLVVAGKWSGGALSIKDRVKSLPSCVLLDRYLADEEFIYLIRNARFVILPYKEYAHSAILFACGWNKAPVIISDSQLFKDIIPAYNCIFPSGAAEKLAAVIDWASRCSTGEITGLRETLAGNVKQLHLQLADELKKAYAGFF